jgi:hypothetical protein
VGFGEWLARAGAGAPPWFCCSSSCSDVPAQRSPRLLWFRALQLFLFKPLPHVVTADLVQLCSALQSHSDGTNSARDSFAIHVRLGDTATPGFYRKCVWGAQSRQVMS